MSNSNELTKTAGAFDIRNFIGVLLGIFGIVLTIAGIVDFTPDEAERTGGIDANLWTGIGLIIAAVLFLAWAKVRPIRIVETTDDVTGTEAAPDND
jgi:drug/metabolite transporter (DMT)-like permease